MISKSFLGRIPVIGLAAFIVLTVFSIFAQNQSAEPNRDSHKVIAYYFHTSTRWSTCRKIEEYSQSAIKLGFPDELKSGKLELRIVNYEKPENRHFIKDYKLVTKSLILVKLVNGKQTEWTNLKLVWQLYKNEEAFFNYVNQEVRKYLAKSWKGLKDAELLSGCFLGALVGNSDINQPLPACN